MNLLITGSAGFIGYHLTRTLLIEGHSIVGIDNLNSYYDIDLKKERLKCAGIDPDNGIYSYNNYRFIRTDICDTDALIKIFEQERFDKVIHLAAQAGVRYSIEHPQAYIQSNIVGFFNILECCRKYGIRQLIYASSSSVYGNSNASIFREEDFTDHPESLYAATKKSNELMAFTYHQLYGLSTIGLRFFTVYGPLGRPDMAPALFTQAILQGKPIKVFNRGELWRDFTYIDDLVERVVYLIEHAGITQNEVYNIGSSRPVYLKEFIQTLEEVLEIEARKEYLPMQKGDVAKTYASMKKFERDFTTCNITPLKQGIEMFALWYKAWMSKSKN